MPGTLGRKLREMREAQGLNQDDLARAVKTSAATISRIENGEIDFAKSRVARDAWRFLGGDDEAKASAEEQEMMSIYRRLGTEGRLAVHDFAARLATMDALLAAKPAKAAEPAQDAQVLQFHGHRKRRLPPRYALGEGKSVEVRRPLRVAAGIGWANIERTDEVIDVPAPAIGRAKARSRWAVEVRGNSMSGTVEDGESVIVGSTRASAGDLACVEWDDSAWVKWLEIDGDELVLVSENPSYPPVRVPRIARALRVEAIVG